MNRPETLALIALSEVNLNNRLSKLTNLVIKIIRVTLCLIPKSSVSSFCNDSLKFSLVYNHDKLKQENV